VKPAFRTGLGMRLKTLALVASLVLASGAYAVSPEPNAAWAELTPAQKQVLAPLERDWGQIDPARRDKWMKVADRYATMPPDERSRLQARMSDWSRMTPAERSRARLQFQEAKQVSPAERRAKWQSYQALPEGERRALGLQARPAATSAAGDAGTDPAADAIVGKKNLVQTTATPRARAVTATSQQARPGATTTPMTARGLPPAHNQAGLPKIVATPGFVDQATLLPKRGPQGAAARPPPASKEAARRPSASASNPQADPQ